MMIRPGDIVTRIWGDGFMETELHVNEVDDEFIYCNAQRKPGEKKWDYVIPPGHERWKFDKTHGVETDESQGWGMEPYGRNLVLSRIERKEDQTDG